MTAIGDILDGFEAELALERELGVWTVEIDRSLLSPATPQLKTPTPLSNSLSPTPTPTPPSNSTPPTQAVYDFVFLHDKPLSKGGIEMMAKIIMAMKKTPDTAPILFSGERPKAKAYVVLGSGAMRQWYPGMRAAPGQWQKDREGAAVLVTYSPEYVLRFGAGTPAVKKIKTDMWTSLKGVMQRTQI